MNVLQAAADLAMSIVDPGPVPSSAWRQIAREKQLPPPGAWFVWLALAGRGWGKTRAFSEWIDERVRSGQTSQQVLIAGRTPADVRTFALEGDGGLLTHHPDIIYEPSKREVRWPNGVVGIIRSGANPKEFRGFGGNTAWLDEFCAWDYTERAWNNLMFGMRATDPRIGISTTPKPLAVLKRIREMPQTIEVSGSSYENKDNLATEYVEAVLDPLKDTRLGRREIFAEVLEDTEGALWVLSEIEEQRVLPSEVPELVRVAVGVDPQGTKTSEILSVLGSGTAEEIVVYARETGIVAVGRGVNNHLYVLEDGSINGKPGEWGARAVAVFERNEADMIVGESNFGGEMVEHTVRTVRSNVPFELVHASRGKQIRAQPVSALYEQNKGHHVGRFAALEDEMTTFVPGGPSPNRMDGLVWAAYAVIPELGAPKKKVRRVKLTVGGGRR